MKGTEGGILAAFYIFGLAGLVLTDYALWVGKFGTWVDEFGVWLSWLTFFAAAVMPVSEWQRREYTRQGKF